MLPRVVPGTLAAVLLFLFTFTGCHGTSIGGRVPDPDAGAKGDAAACGCVIEGDTLVVSWECYCARNGCSSIGIPCQNPTAYPACDLTSVTVNTAGGPWIAVWDSSGTLVGTQSGSDTSPYVCPSDPTLTAFKMRAGRLPEASCQSVACSCVDGGPSCPMPDAG